MRAAQPRDTHEHPRNLAARSSLLPRCPIAVLDREPVREAFAIAAIRIAGVVEMSHFVDQDVVEVEVLDRLLRPCQPPELAVMRPAPAKHPGFDLLLRSRRPAVDFDQRL